jgi:hypothetical protein
VNINTGDTGNSEDKGQGGGLSTEAKIGIGVGVPSAVFTLIGLFIMCAKRG